MSPSSCLLQLEKKPKKAVCTSQQPFLPAGVVEVSPDAPLEEALATLTGEHAVVLPAGLVPTHNAVDHAGLVFVIDIHVAAPSLR